MNWTRRNFLKRALMAGGGFAGLTGGWLGFSDSRRAHFCRQLLADIPRVVPPAPLTPKPAEWSDQRVTVAWLGHATTLINFYGVNILTDPVLFNRIGFDTAAGIAGPKRLVQCALKPGQLPRVDVVLLSHAHFDHLDIASLKSLPGRPQVITASDTSDLLAGLPLQAPRELRWGESAAVKTPHGEVGVEAFEVRHWGRRWPLNKERGYNGYVLEREGRRILFGGDTAFTDRFAALNPRGPFVAALMPVGAYNPWVQSHCTPEEAASMADAAGAQRIVPLHHATFQFSDEPVNEPIERLTRALAQEPERIALRRVGETASFA